MRLTKKMRDLVRLAADERTPLEERNAAGRQLAKMMQKAIDGDATAPPPPPPPPPPVDPPFPHQGFRNHFYEASWVSGTTRVHIHRRPW